MLHGWVFPETSQRSDMLSTLDGAPVMSDRNFSQRLVNFLSDLQVGHQAPPHLMGTV